MTVKWSRGLASPYRKVCTNTGPFESVQYPCNRSSLPGPPMAKNILCRPAPPPRRQLAISSTNLLGHSRYPVHTKLHPRTYLPIHRPPSSQYACPPHDFPKLKAGRASSRCGHEQGARAFRPGPTLAWWATLRKRCPLVG